MCLNLESSVKRTPPSSNEDTIPIYTFERRENPGLINFLVAPVESATSKQACSLVAGILFFLFRYIHFIVRVQKRSGETGRLIKMFASKRLGKVCEKIKLFRFLTILLLIQTNHRQELIKVSILHFWFLVLILPLIRIIHKLKVAHEKMQWSNKPEIY